MTVSDTEENAGRARLTLASAQAPSDEVLCQAFLDGDEAAFTTLVERHRGLVFSLVRRFAPRPEDAADLVQQAFLRALESSGRVFRLWSWGSPTPFRSWLVRIALNLAKNHVRQGNRWRPAVLTEVEEAAVDPHESAQEALERAEQARQLQTAVLALPRRQREVLTLRVDASLPFKDIAETLGISENNAKVQFHNAVKRLKAEVAGAPGENRE
ncbi:sigma-70 family RNA polymerase sigma factor [Stigmatella sp. ncwal1]|uniref:Sigma-70 family RNA polymerase sigma factor n=1 Tax=Stigmatella ashevillensis TaxID=2995309 RepID=A0ABT5DLR7_9BACT|nr:sigma-70 family RNA polymerase sigma factor [Stigmatella ashevillena]MDC0714612.1 sigma-70 family RNA polymerase sigma factor [Stigmatella ashevillena]